jgi:ribonuclease VapC
VIVDTSGIVAVVRRDPERSDFVRQMAMAPHVAISAASYVEACAVLDGLRDPVVSRRLDEALVDLRVRIEAVSAEQASIARQAYRDFGRGSGHRAGLNFGDVFAYGLARFTGEPLLFKGDDFSHTDVRRAV